MIASILVSIISSAFIGQVEENPRQVLDGLAYVTHVYAPQGFDNNDSVQFIVEGEFPTSCYSVGPAHLMPNLDLGQNGQLVFALEAYKTRSICLQVKTRFLKVVEVGLLSEGKYRVSMANDPNKAMATIPVTVAPEDTRDNFEYAPVDSLVIEKDREGKRRLIRLIGNFTNSCLHFPSEGIAIKQTAGDLLEILPVIQMNEGPCLDAIVPFSYVMAVPDSVHTGKYLFHVRTLNGGSLNKIDYVKID